MMPHGGRKINLAWLPCLACVLLAIIPVTSAGPYTNHPTCPRDSELAKQRHCARKCLTDDQCRGKRRCLCDGPCGMVCVKHRKKCPVPEAIIGGEIVDLSGGNYTFGSRIKYTCSEGLILSGDQEKVCQGNGEWSGKPPTCRTEARCQSPPWVPHAKHDGAEDRMSFPLGSQLFFQCLEGYRMEHGFPRALCMGEGRWWGPKMTCSPVRCGHPGNIANSDREGNVFVYPFQVKYTCHNGYRLVGNVQKGIRRCESNSQWSGQPPTCIPIKCPRLAAPENGSMIGMDHTYGAVSHFYCREGHRIVGDSMRKCRMDGTWSGKDVQCTVVDCGTPGPIWNGYLEIGGTTYKSTITFKCNGRTTFEGKGIETICQQDGTWSISVPKCWKQCQVPDVSNGTIIGEHVGSYVDHGRSLMYKCDLTHKNSSLHPTCFNGTWTANPVCEPAPCAKRPEEIRDGHVRYYTTSHGDRARYKCNTGYFLRGPEFVTCQFGDWVADGEMPVCSPVYCDHPGSIKDGKILLVGVIGKYEYRPYVKNVRHNQEIEYHCDKEYKRVGPAAATCVGGRWSPSNLPYCIPKHHPKIMYIFRGKRSVDNIIPALSAGQEDQNDVVDDEEEKGLCEVPVVSHGLEDSYPLGYIVPHNSVLSVVCEERYLLASDHRLSQCDDGTWTSVPLCLPDPDEDVNIPNS